MVAVELHKCDEEVMQLKFEMLLTRDAMSVGKGDGGKEEEWVVFAFRILTVPVPIH